MRARGETLRPRLYFPIASRRQALGKAVQAGTALVGKTSVSFHAKLALHSAL